MSGVNSADVLLFELYAETTGWLFDIVRVTVAFSLTLPSATNPSAKSARTFSTAALLTGALAFESIVKSVAFLAFS